MQILFAVGMHAVAVQGHCTLCSGLAMASNMAMITLAWQLLRWLPAHQSWAEHRVPIKHCEYKHG